MHKNILNKRLSKKRWKEANPALWKEQKKRRQQRNAAWILAFKLSHPCITCGQPHPGCLHFHHRDPNDKTGDIARDYVKWSIKRIEYEIAKCDVLCANCHSILHWEERNGKFLAG